MTFDGQRITGDLAEHDGHLYSDKAPGLALAAIPPVAIAYPFVAEPASRGGIARLTYLATVITAAIPTVITALLIFWLAGALGASNGGALFAAAVFGLGTPAWCYATLFYGHALATACLVTAFSAAVAFRTSPTSGRDWLLAIAVGAGGGWATVTEYQAVVPAALTACLALARARAGGVERLQRVALGVTASALVCAAALVLFNEQSFGAPFALGYSKEVGFSGMSQGFFGLSYPRRGALMEILFGQFRGLFFLAPVLALAPLGFALLVISPASRLEGIVAMAIAAYYVLVNASYYYWDGGWSFGPRHMAPALPMMSLALALLWSRAKPALRVLLVLLALYGAGLTFVAVSTTAQPPDTYHRPVTELLWPNFAKGRVSINWQAFVEDNLRERRDPEAHAWNLGEKIGLTGWWSLVPLVMIWVAVGLVTMRRTFRSVRL